MPPTSRLAAVLLLVAAMTLTGANVAFGKAIAAEIPVYAFVLFRFAVASAALAVMVRGEPGPRLRDMQPAQWRDLALMALLGMVGFTVLMLEGLKRTAAVDAGIITATLPAVVAALGVLLSGDRLSRTQLFAVALAVAGLLLVQTTGAARGTSTLIGNLLVGGAVLCEASFVILGKRLAPPYRPLRLAFGANLVGLVLAIPLALFDAPSDRAPRHQAGDVAARHLVCAGRQRLLPVAVVPRPAARRDVARRTCHRRHPRRRAGDVCALPRRDHRPGQARRRRARHRRHRSRRPLVAPGTPS